MATRAMRLATPAACADTFSALIAEFISISHCVEQFSKRRAALALRQPAVFRPNSALVSALPPSKPQVKDLKSLRP